MKSPFPKEVYRRNAEIYKILANPKRLEILNLLRLSEFSVQQLITVLKIPKANVSQHLALLRYARLVNTKRVGQHIYYKIAHPDIVKPCRILKEFWEKHHFV